MHAGCCLQTLQVVQEACQAVQGLAHNTVCQRGIALCIHSSLRALTAVQGTLQRDWNIKNVKVVFTGIVVNSTHLHELLPLGADALLHAHTNECSQRLACGAGLQKHVEQKKKRPSPFSVNSMRRQVLYRVAQEMQVDMVTAQSETR